MFPNITNISQVYDAIKGRESDYIIAIKEDYGYIAIDYILNTIENFPHIKTEQDAILHEIRGIKFDIETGDIICRPYHKFFNRGEREETQQQNLIVDDTDILLDKLDGSMIAAFYAKDTLTNKKKIYFGTKLGVTQVSAPVDEFVQHHKEYLDFAKMVIELGYTPIFEWCSRKQRIVIDYPNDRLVLTAIRHMHTGKYMQYDEMVAFANKHGIYDVVKKISTGDIQLFVEQNKDQKDIEGWIIRKTNGFMYKIKIDWYLLLHRTKDALSFEKDVIKLILNNDIDDIKPNMDSATIEYIEKYTNELSSGITKTSEEIFNIITSEFQKTGGCRKSFALGLSKNLPEGYSEICFSHWDKDVMLFEIKETIIKKILKSCTSSTNVDRIRHLFGNIKYEKI